MSDLLKRYEQGKPDAGKVDTKGGDKKPIQAEGLSTDEGALKKARGGKLSIKKYSDTVVDK